MSKLANYRARMQAQFRQTFMSLSNPNYRLYSIGQVVSVAGTWMQNIALSWLVYKLTGSAIALGLVSFASNLPLLLFTYFGGMAADRFDRRRILILTQWLDMLQAIVLTGLFLTGMLSVPWLVGLAIYLGCVTALEVPTRQAFVTELVEEHELTNAIALNSAIFNTSRMLGPVLAGFVIAFAGEGFCFVLNALSYVAALFTLYRLVLRKREIAGENGSTPKVAPEPLSHWLRHANVRNLMLLVAVTSMFGFQYAVLMPVIVKQALSGDATTLGLLSAAGGLGALTGSLFLANRGKNKSMRRAIGFASLTLGLSVFGLGLSHSLVLSMLAVSLCGLCISIQLSGSNSLLQATVPKAIRGRVMGVYSMLMLGLSPFAALFAGWFAQSIGLFAALAICSTVLVIASITYLTHTARSS